MQTLIFRLFMVYGFSKDPIDGHGLNENHESEKSVDIASVPTLFTTTSTKLIIVPIDVVADWRDLR